MINGTTRRSKRYTRAKNTNGTSHEKEARWYERPGRGDDRWFVRPSRSVGHEVVGTRQGQRSQPCVCPALRERTSGGSLRAACSCHRKLRQDLPARDDLVDGPILHGLLGGQDEVAVGVLGHLLERLPRVLGDELVQ